MVAGTVSKVPGKNQTIIWNSLTPSSQTSYAQLRDWAEISCDPIEEWIYGNLLPKHGSFAAAFDRQLKPDSILSRQLVMDWFEALQVSGEALCKMVEFIVLRKAAGLDVDKTQIDLLAVSPFGLAGFFRSYVISRSCLIVLVLRRARLVPLWLISLASPRIRRGWIQVFKKFQLLYPRLVYNIRVQ